MKKFTILLSTAAPIFFEWLTSYAMEKYNEGQRKRVYSAKNNLLVLWPPRLDIWEVPGDVDEAQGPRDREMETHSPLASPPVITLELTELSTDRIEVTCQCLAKNALPHLIELAEAIRKRWPEAEYSTDTQPEGRRARTERPKGRRSGQGDGTKATIVEEVGKRHDAGHPWAKIRSDLISAGLLKEPNMVSESTLRRWYRESKGDTGTGRRGEG